MSYKDNVDYALRLLRQGYSPETVEGMLERYTELTALSDPTNVRMKEVTTMAQPRGPVEIMGVTTRTNTSANRNCASCLEPIDVGVRYERVARTTQDIESYHRGCFGEEFGERELYGE